MTVFRERVTKGRRQRLAPIAPKTAGRLSIAFGALSMIALFAATWFLGDFLNPGPVILGLFISLVSALCSNYLYRVSLGIAGDHSRGEMSAVQTIWALGSLDLIEPPMTGADSPTAVHQLMILLPRITSDQAELLTITQLKNLHQYLQPSRADDSPYLAAEVIRTLLRIRDSGAAPLVKDLTGDQVIEPVRGVARRALPEFERLYKESKASRSLLRPAPEVPNSESLLRVAEGGAFCDPNRLLRAEVADVKSSETRVTS